MKKILSSILVFALILTLVQIPCFSVMASTLTFTGTSNVSSLFYNGSVVDRAAVNSKTVYNNGPSRYLYATIDISALKNATVTSALLTFNYDANTAGNTFALNEIDTAITDSTTAADIADINIGDSLGTPDITEGALSGSIFNGTLTIDLASKITELLENDITELSFVLTCTSTHSGIVMVFPFYSNTLTRVAHLQCVYEVKAAANTASDLAISDAGASVTVNYADTTDTLTLYVAAYDANNQLLAVDSTYGEAVALGNRVLELPLPEVEGAVDHYKAFVWNSNLIPACASVSNYKIK